VPSRHRSGAASAGRLIFHRATITLGLLLAWTVALAPSQREQLNSEDFRAKIRKIVADGATPSWSSPWRAAVESCGTRGLALLIAKPACRQQLTLPIQLRQ
jgi:hypothetical protein